MKKICSGVLFMPILLAGCSGTASQSDTTMQALTYPQARKDSVVDTYFGTQVADPYRWLEDDNSAETKAWVTEENKVTQGFLEQISYRKNIQERLSTIWNYAKYSAPYKEGGYYFYYKNDGLQNQSVLYIQNDISAPEGKVLIDPNTLSKDGTTSLSGFSVSKDGKFAAYAISEGGSDWNTIKVIHLPDGKEQGDVIEWVKFSGIAWYKDGFFYSRFPEPVKGDELKSANQFQKVYYHKLGTPQAKDVLVYEDAANPLRGHYASVTYDERFLIVNISQGTYGNQIKVKDLSKGLQAPFTHIITNFDNESAIVDNDGTTMYMYTNIGAGKYKLVAFDLANPKADAWRTVLPERDEVLTSVQRVGGKWIASYIKDASSKVLVYATDGKLEHEVKLPAIGTVSGFVGRNEEQDVFYAFTSFNYPTTIFKYNVATNTSTEYRKPKVSFNPADYEVKQVFYPSKDGTKIPMFLVYKAGLKLNGDNPTLLYGYGGFDISLLPTFSVANIPFLEQGGVYAVANLRGGGEYGEAWHKAGMQQNKQNVFDDFIAAAEFLIREKYTQPSKLAIHGRSNGGLLVGAVMLQRPDLFAVALPGVGVLDMLRFHKFTIGHAWVVEYGSSDDEAGFKNLVAYSPLHNIRENVEYPATMIMTADHDDRVVPAHSFKFAATLQEKYKGKKPMLIRIDTNAGHGAGKSTKMAIDEWADFWSFTLWNLGVKTYKN